MTKREKQLAKLVKKVNKAEDKHPGISGDLMAALGINWPTAPQPVCPPTFDESALTRHRVFAAVVQEHFDMACPGKRVQAYFHDCDQQMHVMKGPDGKDGELPEVWTGLLKEMSQ